MNSARCVARIVDYDFGPGMFVSNIEIGFESGDGSCSVQGSMSGTFVLLMFGAGICFLVAEKVVWMLGMRDVLRAVRCDM